ncbi:MAG: hypothetical protein HY812_03285 [Planctomycetes bacterium]|nr:hypothetical protein [Planctomycetota bacterium]
MISRFAARLAPFALLLCLCPALFGATCTVTGRATTYKDAHNQDFIKVAGEAGFVTVDYGSFHDNPQLWTILKRIADEGGNATVTVTDNQVTRVSPNP